MTTATKTKAPTFTPAVGRQLTVIGVDGATGMTYKQEIKIISYNRRDGHPRFNVRRTRKSGKYLDTSKDWIKLTWRDELVFEGWDCPVLIDSELPRVEGEPYAHGNCCLNIALAAPLLDIAPAARLRDYIEANNLNPLFSDAARALVLIPGTPQIPLYLEIPTTHAQVIKARAAYHLRVFNLVEADHVEEDEDELETVVLIASGYDWECPSGTHVTMNHVDSIPTSGVVTCPQCERSFRVEECDIVNAHQQRGEPGTDTPAPTITYCESNDCEQATCHRCFPRVDCDDHQKCQEFIASSEAYTDDDAVRLGSNDDTDTGAAGDDRLLDGDGYLDGCPECEAQRAAGAHTATPWRWFKSFDETYSVIDSAKQIVASGLTKERAVTIVRAVNAHDALVEAVEFALKYHKMQIANSRAGFPSQLRSALDAALALAGRL